MNNPRRRAQAFVSDDEEERSEYESRRSRRNATRNRLSTTKEVYYQTAEDMLHHCHQLVPVFLPLLARPHDRRLANSIELRGLFVLLLIFQAFGQIALGIARNAEVQESELAFQQPGAPLDADDDDDNDHDYRVDIFSRLASMREDLDDAMENLVSTAMQWSNLQV